MSKKLVKGGRVELLPHTKQELVLLRSWNNKMHAVLDQIGSVEEFRGGLVRVSFQNDAFGYFFPKDVLKPI